MYRIKKLIIHFSGFYQLDTRALAFMRIALGLLLITDLIIRGVDLEAFYGNQGLWPAAYLYSFSGKPGMFTICTWFNDFSWIMILYVFNLVVALCFTIGYKTKWNNFFLWILTLSFHNRNLYILQAGDDLLRLLLLVGLFLPWHEHFSFDKKIKRNRLSDCVAACWYLMLIASVYFFSAALKSSNQWLGGGSAIYYALSLKHLKTGLADYLYPHTNLMSYLTYLVYGIEWLIPILILLPTKSSKPRLIAFLIIVILHLSFALFLNIGLFYLISIVAAIGILPASSISYFFKNKLNKNNTPYTWKVMPPLKAMFCLIMIVTCLSINISQLPSFNYQLKKELWIPIYFLRLDQYWGMFSPGPPQENKHLVYLAYNQKGQQYDIYNNQEYVDFFGSDVSNNQFKSDRWRKLAENVQNDRYSFLRTHYCLYHLKKWNAMHVKNKMSTLNLYSVEEKILSNYQTTKPNKKILCVCDEY